MKTIEVPDELIDLLRQSQLGSRSETDQVRAALATHLFREGLVSVGKAAELAGVPRVEFEWLLAEIAVPTVQYDLAEDEEDRRGISEAIRHTPL